MGRNDALAMRGSGWDGNLHKLRTASPRRS